MGENKTYNNGGMWETEAIVFENINLNEGQQEVNTIPTNQYARAMRLMMENKNLLKNRGALYVGTGKQQTVTPIEGAVPIEIPITAPLNPPSKDGFYYLKCHVQNGIATLYWATDRG